MYIYICIYAYTHIYLSYTNIYVCIGGGNGNVTAYIHICMQLPVYICIYIDTYTHILIRRILNICVYRRW